MGKLHEDILYIYIYFNDIIYINYIKYINDLICINDLPHDVICNIDIYADDTTLYSRCDWTSDLWQQLELPSSTRH